MNNFFCFQIIYSPWHCKEKNFVFSQTFTLSIHQDLKFIDNYAAGGKIKHCTRFTSQYELSRMYLGLSK